MSGEPGTFSTYRLFHYLDHDFILVHSGMQMHAELRSDGMRAVMFVVALDNGDAGETIRVRVAGNSHTLHAQIVDAHSVVIVNGGA